MSDYDGKVAVLSNGELPRCRGSQLVPHGSHLGREGEIILDSVADDIDSEHLRIDGPRGDLGDAAHTQPWTRRSTLFGVPQRHLVNVFSRDTCEPSTTWPLQILTTWPAFTALARSVAWQWDELPSVRYGG